jgi:hypothetical protein
MNKYIVEFHLIDGDVIKEEWETEKDSKDLNKQIAQLLVSLPWYTLIEGENKIINIHVPNIKFFTINNK